MAGRGGGFFGGRGGGGATSNFTTIDGQFGSLMANVEQADEPPTIAMRESFQDSCKSLTAALAKWKELKKADLATLNGTLGEHKAAVPPAVAAPSCGQ